MPEVFRAPEWRHTLAMPEAQAWTSIECHRAPFKVVRVRMVIVTLTELEYREEQGSRVTLLVQVTEDLQLVHLCALVDTDAGVVLREAWAWHLSRRLEVQVNARRLAHHWGLTLFDQAVSVTGHDALEEAARRG